MLVCFRYALFAECWIVPPLDRLETKHETKQRTVHALRENMTSELDRAGGAFEESLGLG